MPRPKIQTPEMTKEILERVSTGETLTGLCKDKHMPSIRALLNWCVADKEFDEQMHRARVRGTLIQAYEAVDAQRAVINGTIAKDDPKRLQAIVTAANNMGHQANAKLSKIDKRDKDTQEVHYTGPMVFGWQNEFEEADEEQPEMIN